MSGKNISLQLGGFLAQLSLYVHKGGLEPDSFHFISLQIFLYILKKKFHVGFPLYGETFSVIPCDWES